MPLSEPPLEIPDHFIINNCLQHLKNHPKRVVFVEGDDIRVVQAASLLAKLECIVPILIGDKNKIHKMAKQHKLPMEFVSIINPVESKDFPLMCDRVVNMARYRNMAIGDPAELVARPHYYASLMVQYGHADAIIAGNLEAPNVYFRALINTIKPLPNVPKIFGVNIILGKHLQNLGANDVLFLADCGLIPEPNVEELSTIAIETAKLARLFIGKTPQVAMLSFSTKSSSSSSSVDRMLAATVLAHEKIIQQYLDIDIIGEVQADVAVNPAAAEVKLPNAESRKSADVLVFPNLDAGHISMKLLQHIAGAEVYGQLILGLNCPAAQVSRTSSSKAIFGTALFVAMAAIKYHELYPSGKF